MDVAAHPGWPARRSLLLAAALLLSLGAVFHAQIRTGFGLVTGDRLDGLIQVSILEHWFNVLRGLSAWDTTNYFHPHRGTLAYNDGYLLYGLAYSVFRALGLDPFLAAEFVNLALRALGFLGAYRFARVVLRLPFAWATLGAVLFTLCAGVHQQSAHAQLLSVALGPPAALLAARTLWALEKGARGAALGWGAGLAALASAWLLTAFYTAWLLGFYALLLALAWLLLTPGAPGRTMAVLRREWLVVGAICLIFAAGAAPFLALYLPKAAESGMHAPEALLPYLPRLVDTLRVGPGNLLFGWLDPFLGAAPSPERLVGWPPVHLACFLAASVWCWRQRPALRPVVVAVAVFYALTLEVGGLSGWWVVRDLVPGAGAVRVVSRAWLVLAGPVLCVVLVGLRGLLGGARLPAAALAAVLVAEQLGSGPAVAALDRLAELRRLRAVPAAPAGCHAFAVLTARTDDPEADTLLQRVSPNANAMLIAEILGLPTINGISTFNPPDWDFADPLGPGYRERVAAYARAHGITALCGLDLRAARWVMDPEGHAPAHMVPTGGTLSLRRGGPGEAMLAEGWHAPDGWGRWGEPRAALRFVPQGEPGPLSLTAWAFALPTTTGGARRVRVVADGEVVATWEVAAEPAEYRAPLPAPPAPGREVRVEFLAEDAADRAGPGGGDTRSLGLGVIALRLDPR